MSVELSAADTGTRRTIQVGARVTVRLAETPTTGYRWQADDDPGLRLVDDRFEGAEVPRGAGGVRVLDFEAVRSGPARLRLAKRRAWGETEPVEEYLVDLEVQPADRQPGPAQPQ